MLILIHIIYFKNSNCYSKFMIHLCIIINDGLWFAHTSLNFVKLHWLMNNSIAIQEYYRKIRHSFTVFLIVQLKSNF